MRAGWDALRAASATADPDAVRQEYDDLFIGVGKSPVNLHGSHWVAGFMMDRPLAELRATLAAMGLARRPGVTMVEDHLSALCETMRLLVAGDSAMPPQPVEAQRTFFERQIAPWYARLLRCNNAISHCQLLCCGSTICDGLSGART